MRLPLALNHVVRLDKCWGLNQYTDEGMVELQGAISFSILFPTQLFPVLTEQLPYWIIIEITGACWPSGLGGCCRCGMKHTSTVLANGQGKTSLSHTCCHLPCCWNHWLSFCPIAGFSTSPPAHGHSLPTFHSRPGLYHFSPAEGALLLHCGIDVSADSRHVYWLPYGLGVYMLLPACLASGHLSQLWWWVHIYEWNLLSWWWHQ